MVVSHDVSFPNTYLYIYILLYTYNHIDIGDVYMICILYIYTCMNAWTAYPDLEDKSIYFELC